VCGRFTLTSTPEELARRFGLDPPVEWSARYNIAPGQDVLAVREEAGRRRATRLRWGLAGDSRRINARIETVSQRPAFRGALQARRCLVPADGFYEWAERGGAKQPYHIGLREGGPFAFAGLWEGETCSVLTTEAAPALREIHGRMPVIVSPPCYADWLDPGRPPERELLAQLVAQAPGDWAIHPVSARVNSARIDDPACIAPAAEMPRQESLF